MKSTIELRPATEKDRLFVQTVYFDTQRWLIEELFGWRGDDVEEAKFDEFYDEANTQIIVEHGNDIGWLTVIRSDDSIEIDSIHVAANRQRNGIGSFLIKQLIEETRSQGKQLTLSTAKANPALGLYKRLGFVPVTEDRFKVYLRLREPDDVAISTDRLELRLMEPGDAQAAFDTYASDPQASKYMTFTTQGDVADTLAFFLQQRKAFDTGNTILWAIRFQNEPTLLGSIELQIQHNEGNVGFIIGKRYWGQGIVTEALTAVARFARKTLFLKRIKGWCDIENSQSARVFEKSGFTNLGTVEKFASHPQMGSDLRDARSFVLEL